MSDIWAAIVAGVITILTAVFSKNIWEDRKHKRETEANIKGRDERIKKLETENAKLYRRVKKLEK